MTSCLLYSTLSPLPKGVHYKMKEFVPIERSLHLERKNLLPQSGPFKRKEFAPCGSKFFPFRLDPLRKKQNSFDRVASLKSAVL